MAQIKGINFGVLKIYVTMQFVDYKVVNSSVVINT